LVRAINKFLLKIQVSVPKKGNQTTPNLRPRNFQGISDMTKKKTNKLPGLFIATVLLILVMIVGVLIYAPTKPHDQPSELSLSQKDVVTLAKVRLASAKNALDGTGEFTVDSCNELGLMAKQFESSADYFSSCSEEKVNLMFLSTPDTSDTKILKLSDDNYTATFVTDNNQNKLINYTFENVKSAGFNKYVGRE